MTLTSPPTQVRESSPAASPLDAATTSGLVAQARAGDGGLHMVHTPLTGTVLGQVPLSSVAQVEQAYAVAAAAQEAWARVAMRQRAQVLLAFHDLVLRRQSFLLDLIQSESGKSRGQAFEEIADVAIVARHYARTAGRTLRERRPLGALPGLSQVVESRVPKGVVGIVSPWNYPLSLAITDALPALMAGNAVVLRPDLQGSFTALAAVRLLREAGLPEAVLQVVLGDGSSIGAAVLERADHVCFTGSTATGRRVGEAAGARLVGASLELGGKNALYVAQDADLDRAVPGAVRACFSSAGQLCISTERVLVHADVYDEFVPRFVAAATALRLGNALAYGYDLGPLVSAQQLERVSSHVEEARRKGATVLAGGRSRPDIAPFAYEATILEGVTPAMACRDEETFGPVVAVYPVADDAAAIALANDTAYGLNASVWTRDIARGRRIAQAIRTGTVNINEGYAAAWGSVAAPMGGMKASGLGRRHGTEGILRFTESQNVTAQRLIPIAPAFGLSDSGFATALTASLRVLKAIGRS